MNKLEDTLMVVVSVAFLLLSAALFAILWFYPSLPVKMRLFFPDLHKGRSEKC